MEGAGSEGQFLVHDVMGRLLITKELRANENYTVLNFNEMDANSGVYFVTMISQGVSKTQRVLFNRQ